MQNKQLSILPHFISQQFQSEQGVLEGLHKNR